MQFDVFQFKTHLFDLLSNRILCCAAVAWVLAQLLKILTTRSFRKEFSAKKMIFGSGGMPSSHSAVVMATCFSCGILYGYDTAVFAIAAILAIVVMRDAAGIRREAGKQAEVINQVSRELGKRRKEFNQITLAELLGHTPLQVLFGALLGVAVAFFCQLWLFDKIPPLHV